MFSFFFRFREWHLLIDFGIGILYTGGIDVDTLFEDEDVCGVFERV